MKTQKKILIGIIFFILIIIVYFYRNKKKKEKNICRGYLTNKEYLEHMIPHHQVAIDISILLQKKSKNPRMQEILRKIIWVQKYEIALMKNMSLNLPKNDMSEDKRNMNTKEIITMGTITNPNKPGLSNTFCDPHFFDPKKHMKHMKHMKLDDKMYIHHMIPHHQVAVDMSKVLLKNTNNDFMIYLANRIIRSQEEEIYLLNNMLRKERYNVQSDLIH